MLPTSEPGSTSSNCSVIPACDLLTGRNNTSPEDALSAFSSWGTVHGSGAQYTRMALALVDNHFGSSPLPAPKPTPQAATAGKRPRAESTSSSAYDSGSDMGRPIYQLSPASGRRASKRQSHVSRTGLTDYLHA